MKRAVGIIGMPNVGKSTLFNALTKTQNAEAANFPFCTIEPNIARVSIPNDELNIIAGIEKSEKIIQTQMEFVDIAGLIKGASTGAGLGNKFLDDVRKTQTIMQVIRCFDDEEIIHVEQTVEPKRDMAIIENELVLSDLQSTETLKGRLSSKKKSGSKSEPSVLVPEVVNVVLPLLEEGIAASAALPDLAKKGTEYLECFESLNFLSGKPKLYVCNVDEAHAGAAAAHVEGKCVNDFDPLPTTVLSYLDSVKERATLSGSPCIALSATLEASAAAFEGDDQMEYLQLAGLKETGLTTIVQVSARLLELLQFYTVGPKEARSWSVRRGATARKAAGVIHSDFERLFIRAETISYSDFVRCGGTQGAKHSGKLRLEGKDYICVNGDIFHFLTGA